MIGWALRWVLVCCGILVLGVAMLDRAAMLLPERAAQPASDMPLATSARPSSGPAANTPGGNTIVFTANERGHVVLDAAVNGAPVRMLVDTGATLVTLTPADARAAGINPASLAFSGHVQTANGAARMAPVTLREIRIGQLSVYDVPASVLEHLDVSLLGMSLLRRLQGYEMRDDKLTITW